MFAFFGASHKNSLKFSRYLTSGKTSLTNLKQPVEQLNIDTLLRSAKTLLAGETVHSLYILFPFRLPDMECIPV